MSKAAVADEAARELNTRLKRYALHAGQWLQSLKT